MKSRKEQFSGIGILVTKPLGSIILVCLLVLYMRKKQEE
jgi:hypothetical protein